MDISTTLLLVTLMGVRKQVLLSKIYPMIGPVLIVGPAKMNLSRLESNKKGTWFNKRDAVFDIEAESISAKEYCNIHGLWEG